MDAEEKDYYEKAMNAIDPTYTAKKQQIIKDCLTPVPKSKKQVIINDDPPKGWTDDRPYSFAPESQERPHGGLGENELWALLKDPGTWIHLWRTKNKVKLSELANGAQISISFLSDIEHGRNPSVKVLYRIADYIRHFYSD